MSNPPASPAVDIRSPFRFGFFAGIGFFFASMLMSGAMILFFGMGFGILVSESLHKAIQSKPDPSPVTQTTAVKVRVQPNRIPKPALAADDVQQ